MHTNPPLQGEAADVRLCIANRGTMVDAESKQAVEDFSTLYNSVVQVSRMIYIRWCMRTWVPLFASQFACAGLRVSASR